MVITDQPIDAVVVGINLITVHVVVVVGIGSNLISENVVVGFYKYW